MKKKRRVELSNNILAITDTLKKKIKLKFPIQKRLQRTKYLREFFFLFRSVVAVKPPGLIDLSRYYLTASTSYSLPSTPPLSLLITAVLNQF